MEDIGFNVVSGSLNEIVIGLGDLDLPIGLALSLGWFVALQHVVSDCFHSGGAGGGGSSSSRSSSPQLVTVMGHDDDDDEEHADEHMGAHADAQPDNAAGLAAVGSPHAAVVAHAAAKRQRERRNSATAASLPDVRDEWGVSEYGV